MDELGYRRFRRRVMYQTEHAALHVREANGHVHAGWEHLEKSRRILDRLKRQHAALRDGSPPR